MPTFGGLVSLLLLAICSASGCTRGESTWQRVSVTGTVTYRGQAVADGAVSLRPVSETGGLVAGAAIRDGRFEIPEEEGPIAGNYQAKLLVPVGGDSSSAKNKPRSPFRQLPKMLTFERNVKFTAGSNTLRFDLK
jgi:hypothetical protein